MEMHWFQSEKRKEMENNPIVFDVLLLLTFRRDLVKFFLKFCVKLITHSLIWIFGFLVHQQSINISEQTNIASIFLN